MSETDTPIGKIIEVEEVGDGVTSIMLEMEVAGYQVIHGSPRVLEQALIRAFGSVKNSIGRKIMIGISDTGRLVGFSPVEDV